MEACWHQHRANIDANFGGEFLKKSWENNDFDILIRGSKVEVKIDETVDPKWSQDVKASWQCL